DYFHFVPSNPWVAMGWRDTKDISFPIGRCLADRGIDFIPKALKKVDGANNQVELVDGTKLAYDFLILATGPKPAFDEIEGLDPDKGYVHSVVHMEDAHKSFTDYQEFVKNPGPIVIGAVQNSSIIGPVYEFAFLVDADLRRRNIRDRVPITLITPEPYVGHLGLGIESDTRRLLEEALAARNITYLTNVKTKKIESGVVHIAECDALGNEARTSDVPFAYSVYWAAFRGIHALRDSTGLTDERGFVKTDEYLRSTAYPNIYAVGVCGAHPSVSKSPLPLGAPDSVYTIQNEVDAAVRNIEATLKGEALTSPAPIRAKWLTDMSKSGALYHSEPQIPLRNINWLKEGKWVHLAKVDFENYFINKIKLKPATAGVPVSSHIATLMRKLQTPEGESAKVSVSSRAATRPLAVPVKKDFDYDLRALSQTLGQEEHALAAALLESALRDAKSLLAGVKLDDMQKFRHDLMIADLPENQPGVEFHGGGT
ncbi:NAD(P)/FAD-dependent oxidoreductase, partial [Sulfurirhabdus autotrophica]